MSVVILSVKKALYAEHQGAIVLQELTLFSVR
jgi:hypothetical protein